MSSAAKMIRDGFGGSDNPGLTNLLKDLQAQEAAEEGMAATRSERLELKGEELEKARLMERHREFQFRDKDQEVLATLMVPGSWNCKWCKYVNKP